VITDRQTGKSRGYGFVSINIVFICHNFTTLALSVKCLQSFKWQQITCHR
jgi:hypothetical protein